MPRSYFATHCFMCRAKLGTARQKVTFMREEPYSDRHPNWLTWKSKGGCYLCDACMGKVRELLGVEVDA